MFDLNGFDQTIAGLYTDTAAGANDISGDQVTNSSSTLATLTIDNAGVAIFAGTFTGNLALAKYGVGTLTTDGDSTNSGPVDVYDGTLDVTGSFTVVPAIPGQGNPQVTGLPTTDTWVVTASDLYKGNASWTCSASLPSATAA